MITGITPIRQISAWQRELAQAITDPAELLCVLGLNPSLLPATKAAAALFPLRVPRGYVARMRREDPHDPLLRQVLPLGEETLETPGFITDPVSDRNALVAPGVLHKYQGRVLLIVTGACGVHCRYCFRREFPYAEARLKTGNWHQALEYIANDSDIDEVILSGGDPLSLSNRRLAALMADLTTIPHIERLRIHSRQPIVLPARVEPELIKLLKDSQLQIVLVLHANHPNEVDQSVNEALKRLVTADVVLLNQAVLLKGVNDSATVLAELSKVMFRAGVLPYYLHVLDQVTGAAHFLVEEDCALMIMEELRTRLPGYLLPRLVREEAGKPAKTLIR